MSKTFINASSKYKLEKLRDGLNFINIEKPNYEIKLALLQKDFYKYEQKYQIIRDERGNIINVIKKDNFLKDKIKNLEKEGSPSNLIQAEILKERLLEIEDEFQDPTKILNTLNSIEKEMKQYSDAINRFVSLSETYRLEIARIQFHGE